MKCRFALLAVPLLAMYSIGCTGEQGPPGPEGPSSDASINAIIPGKVFLGRTVDVTISGFNTSWTESAKIDFGPGVIVESQTLASPTAIVATVRIVDSTDPGVRDVNVVDGGNTVTYKGAFKLESPLQLDVSGVRAQGSILFGKAKQKDLSTPFDTTSTGDGFFEPLEYPNLNLVGSTGINPTFESVDSYALDVLITVDVDTPAGKAEVSVESGTADDMVVSPSRGELDIEARMPDPLPVGAGVKGTIDAPYASLLYSFTPSEPGVYSIKATASKTSADPAVALLPASGRFAHAISFGADPTIVATNADPFYLVYWDNTGESGYFATLQATKVVISDVEPNDTCANAQPAGALPANIKNMAMTSTGDIDWVSFDVGAADIGKIAHVTTAPGDAKTDTVLEVFASNCTTSLGGPSSDGNYHEDFKSNPITAAGKYFVKVTNSDWGYSGTLYNLTIALEAAP